MITKTSSDDSPEPKVRGSRRASPRVRRIAREAVAAKETLPGKVFPQWLRTALVALAWIGTLPVYVQLVSPYSVMYSAQSMGVGLAIFSALGAHIWRTRTSPWRTVAWAWGLSTATGMTMLLLGADRLALTTATLVGFSVSLLRINQNGRKLWNLVQTWRRFR